VELRGGSAYSERGAADQADRAAGEEAAVAPPAMGH
jgi:hypothetical protein